MHRTQMGRENTFADSKIESKTLRRMSSPYMCIQPLALCLGVPSAGVLTQDRQDEIAIEHGHQD